jgi:hypothetical protein
MADKRAAELGTPESENTGGRADAGAALPGRGRVMIHRRIGAFSGGNCLLWALILRMINRLRATVRPPRRRVDPSSPSREP